MCVCGGLGGANGEEGGQEGGPLGVKVAGRERRRVGGLGAGIGGGRGRERERGGGGRGRSTQPQGSVPPPHRRERPAKSDHTADMAGTSVHLHAHT